MPNAVRLPFGRVQCVFSSPLKTAPAGNSTVRTERGNETAALRDGELRAETRRGASWSREELQSQVMVFFRSVTMSDSFHTVTLFSHFQRNWSHYSVLCLCASNAYYVAEVSFYGYINARNLPRDLLKQNVIPRPNLSEQRFKVYRGKVFDTPEVVFL